MYRDQNNESASLSLLHRVKILLAIAIANLALVSESWAATCIWNGTKLTVTGSGDEEFTGCSDGSNHKAATEVIFGNGITSIGANTFNKAYSLKSVDMQNVITLGMGAFAYARSLESVNMPNVKSMGASAFREARSLTSIDISNVTYIAGVEFRYANALTDIIISDETNTARWHNDTFEDLVDKANITCLGALDICKDKLSKYGIDIQNRVQKATKSQCNASGNYYYDTDANSGNGQCQKLPDSQAACRTASLYWAGDKCFKACPANTFSVGGECLPKRYTPAEVAKVVGESNTILLYYK